MADEQLETPRRNTVFLHGRRLAGEDIENLFLNYRRGDEQVEDSGARSIGGPIEPPLCGMPLRPPVHSGR